MIARAFFRLFCASQRALVRPLSTSRIGAKFYQRQFQEFTESTMSLTRNDVENIAHLARLALSEEQLPVYVDSLSKIFSFVEQLNAADTAKVEPMAHPLADQVQRVRPDEVLDADRHEKYQRNAPRVEADLYLVPKVIE
jgi:aspartyl-tRNA(Asn)/glutamyl-tRNA(Gln) amidotransferase subunit C